MTEENQEKVRQFYNTDMDLYDFYRCDKHGVSVPIGYHYNTLFNSAYPHRPSCSIEIHGIGLLLSCSDKDILKRLVTDGRIDLNIDHHRHLSKPFAAFIDKLNADQDVGNAALSGINPAYDFAVATKVPVNPRISLAEEQPFGIGINLPGDLIRDLQLMEHAVFVSKLDSAYRKDLHPSDWFVRIGVRIIGYEVREIF